VSKTMVTLMVVNLKIGGRPTNWKGITKHVLASGDSKVKGSL